MKAGDRVRYHIRRDGHWETKVVTVEGTFVKYSKNKAGWALIEVQGRKVYVKPDHLEPIYEDSVQD